jgi:hypothetical protein
VDEEEKGRSSRQTAIFAIAVRTSLGCSDGREPDVVNKNSTVNEGSHSDCEAVQ